MKSYRTISSFSSSDRSYDICFNILCLRDAFYARICVMSFFMLDGYFLAAAMVLDKENGPKSRWRLNSKR
uniref:Uncharacterized protein n=1 Tax=Parascaris univalens TaxID=6257 RepID=A0A915AHC1_PARUN